MISEDELHFGCKTLSHGLCPLRPFTPAGSDLVDVRHRRVESTKRAAGCYQQKKGRISLVLGHGVYLASKGGSWVKVKKRWRPWRAKCRRRRSPGSREEGKRQLGVVFGTEQRRRRAAAVVSPAARAMSGQSEEADDEEPGGNKNANCYYPHLFFYKHKLLNNNFNNNKMPALRDFSLLQQQQQQERTQL